MSPARNKEQFKEQILNVLRGATEPMKATEISAAIGPYESGEVVYRYLLDLKERGLVETVKEHRGIMSDRWIIIKP